MTKTNRLSNSVRNSQYSFFAQIIQVLLSFVNRWIFIRVLGVMILGINGLFTNIITILSLAELGIGPAMIQSMYAPAANSDKDKMLSLLNLYRKSFWLIATTIIFMGIITVPFVQYFGEGISKISNYRIIYMLFILNSSVGYIFAHRHSILIAYEKEFIITKVRIQFSIIRIATQILLLIFFKSYLLYLICQLLITLCQEIILRKHSIKHFPFTRKIDKENQLKKSERKNIFKNIRALMITKFGYVILNGTDNLIISTFISVSMVGYYSNYLMLIGAITMIVSQVFSSITASIGNYVAKESVDDQVKLFEMLDFLVFSIYLIMGISFVYLSNIFIEVWLGESYLLSFPVVSVMALNFFMNGVKSCFWMYRSTMGLFTQGKYRPLVVAAINITISIILVKPLGLLGILLGTFISRLSISMWYEPLIIYKYGFNRKVSHYYKLWIPRIIMIIIINVIMRYIVSFEIIKNCGFDFIIILLLSLSISVGSIMIVYIKSPEMKKLLHYVKRLLKR